jgi:(R,R)-butanediol dehydrogenase/meso-butanediol dehydrogenase/diacetyl reductase
MKVGDLVTVLGAGPIGLMCVAAARAAGAHKVLVSEPTEARRQAALEMGADEVVDPASEDVIERMVALTAGHGPDIVFEAAAAKPTLDQSLKMVRRAGQVMLVAIAWEPVAVMPSEWMAREVGLNTTFSTDAVDWRTALGLLASGEVDISPMVDQASFVPLDDIQQAFEALVVPTTQLQMVVNPWD